MSSLLPVLTLLGVLTALAMVFILLQRTAKQDDGRLESRLESLERALERSERTSREELARNREELSLALKETREEIATSVRSIGDALLRRQTEASTAQKDQLEIFSRQLTVLTEQNVQKLDKINETVEGKLRQLQEETGNRLEQMRATVDEKLHDTLEKRLGESFKLVSERLEQVHKGLGEMQHLAVGVGDLKKVLSNVKTRGTLGEIQLGTLLEQILSPEQYAANVATRPGSSNRVEFAIRLPGRDGVDEKGVWLPIDAKFPQEDYLRLVEAQEQGDANRVQEAGRQLERTLREMAKQIREKYLEPPHTTDFGLLFLPTEGLYAEILRNTGLVEELQRDGKVIVAGPTTLAALLNSLQMGFRTLAIEKRSSEVWQLLGAVKSEFGKFATVLAKTRKKLDEASNTIEQAETRTRVINRKLKGVEELAAPGAAALIGMEEDADNEEEESG